MRDIERTRTEQAVQAPPLHCTKVKHLCRYVIFHIKKSIILINNRIVIFPSFFLPSVLRLPHSSR
jgi:hypothetical protein